MRLIMMSVLTAILALTSACASIPFSTALSLSSMSPRALAQIDATQVRVRISVPAGFEIDVPESHLWLSLATPSGSRSADMGLSLLGVAEGSRPGGWFKDDITVSTYLLALSPDGVRELKALQRQVLAEDPTSFEFSVSAPFAKVPANPTEVTFWADLKLSAGEPFMRLIDGATIEFERRS